jgi:hypothetical protein
VDDFDSDEDASPVEIHLLDPSFEPSAEAEEDDDLASEIDLSDMAMVAGQGEDDEEYADATFIADLTAGLPAEQDSDDMAAADAAITLVPEDAVEAAEADGGAVEAGHPDTPGGTDLAALVGTAGPAAESEPAEVRREGDSGLVTETMAVLYRSQGFHDRAADVYRSLLRARPGDERLEAKLREAEAAAAGAGAGRVEEPRGDDDAGEVWLRGVGSVWTDADAAGGEATPYAWTPEPDEVESGEPIGSYLRDLVDWKGGRGRYRQPDPSTARPTPPAPGSGADTGTIPDWLTDPGASREWANTTPDAAPPGTPPAAPSDGEEPRADAPASGPTATPPPPPAAPPPSAPWAEAAPPEPAEPWTELVPAETWTESAPAAPTEPAPEEGTGWTPEELDSPAPDSAPPVEPDPAALSTPEDEAAEDEDLEMFRSWLQSLKK